MTDIRFLPAATAAVYDWQALGACRSSDPEVFFHPEGERGSRRQRRDAAAKAVCSSCPALIPCRTYALSSRQPYGVWGGLTEDERVELLAADGPPVPA